MTTIQLGIEGMTCANCSARIERALGKAEDPVEAEREARERALRALRRDLGVAALFTVPLVALTMLPMFVPEVDAVKRLQERGGKVAFVGDGRTSSRTYSGRSCTTSCTT